MLAKLGHVKYQTSQMIATLQLNTAIRLTKNTLTAPGPQPCSTRILLKSNDQLDRSLICIVHTPGTLPTCS